jgi:hypothetical protein
MKNKNFLTLPRHVRGDKRQRIKNDINEHGFSSDLMLINLVDDNVDVYWFDFYFLSPTNNRIFYNTNIITKELHLLDIAQEKAHKEADCMLTDEQLENEHKMEFVPHTFSKTGKVLTYRLIFGDPIQYDCFNGLTYSDYVVKRADEIMTTLTFDPKDTYTIDTEYRYGVGLSIVADVVDIPSIVFHMEQFLKAEPRFK